VRLKVTNRAPWRPVPLSWPYNEVRPQRAIRSAAPASADGARKKAAASPSFVKVGGRRLRFDRVDEAGKVTLGSRDGSTTRSRARLLRLADRHAEIVGLDGSPLRRLVLDPTKDDQWTP